MIVRRTKVCMHCTYPPLKQCSEDGSKGTTSKGCRRCIGMHSSSLHLTKGFLVWDHTTTTVFLASQTCERSACDRREFTLLFRWFSLNYKTWNVQWGRTRRGCNSCVRRRSWEFVLWKKGNQLNIGVSSSLSFLVSLLVILLAAGTARLVGFGIIVTTVVALGTHFGLQILGKLAQLACDCALACG